jgi:hypothetical protein
MTLLVIALIIVIAFVWIVSLYYQLEQVKSHLRKLPEVAKEIDNNTNTLETEVFILRRALLNVVRGMNDTVNKMANTKSKAELDSFRKSYSANSIPAQAAFIYYANIYNTGHTTELLKKIYKDHNLPTQFSSQFAMMEYNALNNKQWSTEVLNTNNEKYEKMLKRMLKTDFENIQDEIEAEEKQQNELDKKYSEYS